MAQKIVLTGDNGLHDGYSGHVASSLQSSFKVGGVDVAVQGSSYICNHPDHGAQTIVTPGTVKSTAEGKLIVVEGATASCGAVLLPIDRKVYVE